MFKTTDNEGELFNVFKTTDNEGELLICSKPQIMKESC